ncbi:MAG: GNAT family N-acetyltransferase [Mycobacteriales bacterium]
MADDLSDFADLLAATGGDPLARASLRGRRFAGGFAAAAATCWLGVDAERRSPAVTALGPGPAVARLLAEVRDTFPDRAWTSLPREAVSQLAAVGLELTERVDWDFRWTPAAPPPQPAEAAVTVLGAGASDEVAALLELHSPTASTRPGDPAARRWVGAGEPLVVVAADTTGLPDVGHISSVATAAEARGQGWGAAVTAALARMLLAEGCDIVTLGLYAGNDPARRLYSRLGFRDEHERSGGRLVAH